MDGVLSMDNILSEDEAANLFIDSADDESQETQENPQPEENEEEDDTTEVNSEDLFGDDTPESNLPESVGSEEKTAGTQEGTTSEEDGTSPDTNFYSSIASALKEDGVFPDLDDKLIESVTEPEHFRDLIQQLIQAGIDEANKRVYEALNNGVEPNVIRQYENTMKYLNDITDDILSEESDRGEDIRRKILLQDFMNRGYKPDKAARMTERLFASGEDVEEARLALEGNKQYFGSKYKELLDNAKAEEEKEKKAVLKLAEELKKDIMSSEKVFGDIPLDKATRQKVYDIVTKPVWKNPETGQYLTEMQKYRQDNPNDFIKNVGLLYTLTNGFKDIDKLVKPQTKKEVKSKLRELEHTLNNTARRGNGTLKYVANEGSSGSFFDNGFNIDLD